VPKDRASEFFGFMTTTSRFAGILGPLAFGLVSRFAGSSRLSIVALIVFFAVGGGLLRAVDEKKGIAAAGPP
jgi:UMF1 family MFS transporter